VLASGTFDLLHFGHVRFLEEAKRAGDEDAKLVVVVARDRTVVERKGERPVMSEDQRRALVEALRVVDEAILGFEDFSIEKVVEKGMIRRESRGRCRGRWRRRVWRSGLCGLEGLGRGS